MAGPASLCPWSGDKRVRCNTCEPVVHINPAAFPFSSSLGTLWGNGRASLSWPDLILSQGSVLEAGRSCRAVLSAARGRAVGREARRELCNGFPRGQGKMGCFPSARTKSSCTACSTMFSPALGSCRAAQAGSWDPVTAHPPMPLSSLPS